MIALYIILAILLLIIALFSLKASVVLTYKNDVDLKLSVLGIKFDLYPKNQKKIKIKKRKKLLKGKRVIIPGFSNKALVFFARFIPGKLLSKITYKIQSKKGKKSEM